MGWFNWIRFWIFHSRGKWPVEYLRIRGETVSAVTGTRTGLISSEEIDQHLLPGIPNEITLDLITTKLSWRDLRSLSRVNSRWRQAVENHIIYDVRVRSHATETLVVVVNGVSSNHSLSVSAAICAIALYSMRDKSWCKLPSIPGIEMGVPYSCQCVSLDGKIYILGGAEEILHYAGSKRVYVLDLAGKAQWRQCASMQEPRLEFGSCVKDGKIYVFGGISLGELVSGSEVYDPEINAWTRIKPMICSRFQHAVAPAGEELFVHGGKFDHATALELADGPAVGPNAISDDESSDDESDWGVSPTSTVHGKPKWKDTKSALFLEVYHSSKDEWRLIKPFGRHRLKTVFMAQGKFHAIDEDGIYVHDKDKHSWALLQPCLFPGIKPMDFEEVEPCTILALDDELLVLAHCYKGDRKFFGSGLFQSKGFGNKNEAIVWEKAKYFPYCEVLCDHFVDAAIMCPIQL